MGYKNNDNYTLYWWCNKCCLWIAYHPFTDNTFHRLLDNNVCYRNNSIRERRIFKYFKKTGRRSYNGYTLTQIEERESPITPWKIVREENGPSKTSSST